MPRGISVRPHVRELFERKPGQTIYMSDLKAAIVAATPGTTPREIREGGVQKAVGELQRQGFPVEIVERGRAWRYLPNKVDAPANGNGHAGPSKAIFQLIGEARDGRLVLECEDGRLFMAQEL